MKIVVAGGAGFIGSRLVLELQKEHTVYSIDTLTEFVQQTPIPDFNNLIEYRTEKFIYDNAKIDVRNLHSLSNFFSDVQPDCVINLTGTASGKLIDSQVMGPHLASQTMILGLINLLEACSISKVHRFVQVSSSMVYGNYKDDPITETAICAPINMYGILKYSGEMIVKDFCSKHGIEYTIIRPTAVYGEGDNNNRVIGKFISLARQNKELVIDNPSESLDFTHIDDLTKGIVSASTVIGGVNQTFNLSHGLAIPLTDVAQWIKLEAKSTSNIKTGKLDPYYPKRGALDCTKASTKFYFQPTIDPYTGIKKYYAWHKDFFQ